MTQPTGTTGPDTAGVPPPDRQGERTDSRARPSLLWRWAVPALKFLVAGGLLYYVLATQLNPEGSKELRRVFLESPSFLAAAFLAVSMQLFVGTQRVRLLLGSQGFRIGYLNMLRLTYLGAFFDTFMVTSVGGDAVKAVYLARESPAGQRVESVSVLVLDRFIGLLGLVSLMLAITTWHLDVLQDNRHVQPYLFWLFLVPCLLFVGAFMLLSEAVYSWRPLQFLLRMLPGGAFIVRAYYSLQRFRRRPFILLAAFGLTLIVHTLGFLCGYMLVRGMGHAPALLPFLVAWFISNFICSFAPVGGIGVGQAVYIPIFLTIAGVPNGWVLATAVQATYILAKSPGFIAWLLSREYPSGPRERGTQGASGSGPT